MAHTGHSNGSNNISLQGAPATWPAGIQLQSLTLRDQLVRFEPITAADFPSVADVIVEHFIPDEPLIRAAGAGAALQSAKQNPESAQSAEFWRESRAFVTSFFLAPALASRPNVSFKVVTSATKDSKAETQEQQVIGVALAHVDYLEPNDNGGHSVYVNAST